MAAGGGKQPQAANAEQQAGRQEVGSRQAGSGQAAGGQAGSRRAGRRRGARGGQRAVPLAASEVWAWDANVRADCSEHLDLDPARSSDPLHIEIAPQLRLTNVAATDICFAHLRQTRPPAPNHDHDHDHDHDHTDYQRGQCGAITVPVCCATPTVLYLLAAGRTASARIVGLPIWNADTTWAF
ncbi:hypothetical protein Aca07nite_35030 [Actinoplanes capillaceus]|uniref:Uncharacterized protein n=1 Tax=Actinoplanes campanulatus TaxID=113559 RepID=A0ABQ3WJ14_9ACTN|nr:hypothetical protein Aca07nite_35030 [Actinoplanes capillaceus]